MRSGHTILVVDDDASSLYVASRLLRKAGFQVLEASNGEDAIRLSGRASAFLLDVNLPDLNGVAVCQAIKVQSQKPVALMSAVYVDDLHRDATLQAGADVYFLQPIDGEQVVLAFDRLLA
jgi:CheY-like chemotaxis protein